APRPGRCTRGAAPPRIPPPGQQESPNRAPGRGAARGPDRRRPAGPAATVRPVLDVEVERQDQGLLVRWTVEDRAVPGGGEGPFVVSVGEHPDAIDHAHPVAVVADGREVLLRGLDPGVRHYVGVGVQGDAGVVAAEPREPFDATL